MPPRVSRASVKGAAAPKAKPRNSLRKPKKAQKRALDAFSIAGHDEPDRPKIRQNRLGEIEGGVQRKRRREDEEDEEDEDGEEAEAKRRKRRSGSFDEGSDSEGNTWTMGHVEDDDDSDIDSDEAFGESDEERFEGWTFRGSSSNQKGRPLKKKKKARALEDMDEDEDMEIDLDEGESADGEEDDEDDLGEDAIDLATALDQYEESEEEEREQKDKKGKRKISAFDDDSDESPSEGEDIGRDGASEFSSDDDEDEDEEDKRAQLKDLISSLPVEDEAQVKTARKVEVHEGGAPSEFGVLRKVDLSSLKSKIADPEMKKALKLLQDDVKSSKRNDIAKKLDAPLPKRQQDKLDRAAATEKTNETLERWVDTVKQNRRAEHLSFPLKHPDSGKAMGETRLQPTTTTAPTNELESTIQSILQQSGLSNGKDDEEQIQKWEELQTNKLPLEEVLRRRAQLRKERELLFREEVRAKRIKKIKSKSYRRVHRKERERLLEKEREGLKNDGIDISEDEREYNDRRRAEERMGAKHRESRWAKGIKATGRAAWDDDARAGVTDMARRNEELRRRIEGKVVRDDDEDGSDFSSEDEEDADDDDNGDELLKKQLGRLENPFSTDNSKLGSMAFMQKAETSRRARNDEDIERIRRELAGEDSDRSEDDENATRVGRRKFGPSTNAITPAVQIKGSEFEERIGSDDEEAVGNSAPGASTNGHSNGIRKKAFSESKTQPGNSYLAPASKESKPGQAKKDLVLTAEDTVAALQEQPKPSKSKSKSTSTSKPKGSKASNDELPEAKISEADADGWQTVTYEKDSDVDDDDEGIDLDIVPRNESATTRGFAGDNIEHEFAQEKEETIKEDDSKTVVNHLPGWGAWAGEGLTASQRKNKGKKTVTKQQGIRPDKRKDAKLDRVIINEKRIKSNTKYLASQLPHQFETKEQYERSLRMPQGPEWTAKKTFQDATKPRVLVKQGIIRPMHKPLV